MKVMPLDCTFQCTGIWHCYVCIHVSPTDCCCRSIYLCDFLSQRFIVHFCSSKLACEKKCRDTVGVRPSKPNRCLKVLNPSEGGDMVCGDGSVSRWGYDKTTGNCVQFQWNGCKKGSNNNRFR